MITQIRNTLLTITMAFVLALGVGAPALAATSATEQVCQGVGIATGSGCDNPTNSPSVNSVVRLIVNILSILVGVVAVIMIIIGGLKYVTSGGDSNNVNSAKNTILYAIVGLIVVALAQIIVRFVLDKLS